MHNENLMTYITVHQYVPDDYRQKRDMYRDGYVSYV